MGFDDPRSSSANRVPGFLATPPALFVLSLLALLVALRQPPKVYDEGIIAYGAERVLNGELPYRDFWTLYAPGQFYVVAALFKLLGTTLSVERLWDTVVRAALSVLAFLVARRVAEHWPALLAWLATTLWLVCFGFPGYTTFPALLFTMAGVWLLLRFLAQPQQAPSAAAAGLSVGVATLFRHDLGAYAALAGLVTLVLRRWIRNDRSQIHPLARSIAPIACYLVGILVVLLPAGLYLIRHAPIHELGRDLFVVPLTIFPRVRSLPYPPLFPNPGALLPGGSLEALPFYFPFAAFAGVILVLLGSLARRQRFDEALPGLLLVLLVGLFGFNQARVRSDLIHLPQTLIPAIILAAALMSRTRSMPPSPQARVLAAVSLGALLLMLVQPSRAWLGAVRGLVASRGAPLVPRAGWVHVDPDQAGAVNYIRERVPEREPIFVGNVRHDRLVISDVLFYFLAERPSTMSCTPGSPRRRRCSQGSSRI